MSWDEALQTFVIESRELLQQMEESLLQIEQNPDDGDLINAIFRAAHTIKGSAGLFGLDHIVAYTHVAENVLDNVRAGTLPLTADLVALFLSVSDQLVILIEHVDSNTEISSETQQQSDDLVARLQRYQSQPEATNITTIPEHQASYVKEGGGIVETDNWHLSLRFNSEALRNGMDPLAFIRYLSTLGEIVTLVTLSDALPPAAEMDPEICYLGFEIAFFSQADKATIESVFEFVREDSKIHIVPPRSKIAEYIELIENLPEQELRLGEILIQCGTLTEMELQSALQQQGQLSDKMTPLGEVLMTQSSVEAPVVKAALDKQKQIKDNKTSATNTIRVDAEKLDHLINLVGELTVAGASANLIAQTTNNAELLEANTVMSRLVEEVRDSALTLRMVQIGATFSRFTRVVRDVSIELGKDIDLIISGADTELDRTVVERIGDPLTHLVRNSMDHGIESASVRLEQGKPAKGQVRLNAYHDSGSVVIEVSDDGGGLNKDKILEKAISKGLVTQGQNLSEQEIFNLIFEAGFSTVDTVSNLSGRGVGMDVVRSNILALRGSIEIISELHVGTMMRIRLPLTLAIIDGFLIGVGNASYVLPQDMVVECIELPPEKTASARRDFLNLRGELLPYIRLRDLFNIPGSTGSRQSIVVVQSAGQKAGFVVDNLIGEFQTIIKPLGEVFKDSGGIAGFTILGSGNVALILDVPGLMRQVISDETLKQEQFKRAIA